MGGPGGGVYNGRVRRILTTEWLDLGGATYPEVVDDMLQIRWFNRYCGGARALLTHLDRLIEQDGPASSLSLLDVATGSADLPLRIVRWAARRGLDVRIAALDRHPEVLRFARAETRTFPQVGLIQADARDLPVRRASCDYALSSLFLHQLDEAAGAALLRRLLEVSKRAVLINDLVRHALHYAGAWTLARCLTRNPITRNDAPASVRNAYTVKELRELGRASGASRVEVFRHAPFRACLVLRP